jgi:hypothetical protein
LALAAPVRADDGHVQVQTPISGADVIVNLFLFPYALAYSQEHFGLGEHPYADEAGYGRGGRTMAVELGSSAQWLPWDRSGSPRVDLRVRGENRLGWDAAWTGFGAATFGRSTSFWSGHVTGNYLQSPASFLEVGLGAAGISGKAGPSAELAFETFPRRPWTLAASWSGTLIQGDVWNELSVSAGAVWENIGLTLGWRAFLAAPAETTGPEAGLRFWF